MTKELAKKATDSMKKPKHLRTDNMKTVNYISDVEPDDWSSVNYNSGLEIDNILGAETIEYNLNN